MLSGNNPLRPLFDENYRDELNKPKKKSTKKTTTKKTTKKTVK